MQQGCIEHNVQQGDTSSLISVGYAQICLELVLIFEALREPQTPPEPRMRLLLAGTACQKSKGFGQALAGLHWLR